jgi:hypothetical protein
MRIRARRAFTRGALELAVGWACKYDAALKLPYQDNLSALRGTFGFTAARIRRASVGGRSAEGRSARVAYRAFRGER